MGFFLDWFLGVSMYWAGLWVFGLLLYIGLVAFLSYNELYEWDVRHAETATLPESV